MNQHRDDRPSFISKTLAPYALVLTLAAVGYLLLAVGAVTFLN